MRIKTLSGLLNLWEKNNLISGEQSEKILLFMKERECENFFRFLKWVSITGAFWIVLGIIITVINLFQTDLVRKFINGLYNLLAHFAQNVLIPFFELLEKVFGGNYKYFLWGVFALILFFVFHCQANKFKLKVNTDKLNLTEEASRCLRTNFVAEVFASVSLAAVFCLFNMLLIPIGGFHSADKIFPLWNFFGAVTFLMLAYKNNRVMYLLFGIYFISLTAGMFSGYGYATYWICVSRPIVQIVIALILLLTGYVTELKSSAAGDPAKEKFAAVYNWTGLLMLFIALWIASIRGFDLHLSNRIARIFELWFSNILFIISSLLAMYYGTKTDKPIYFNYGLTFLILETYTVFCSRVWSILPVGFAALLFGAMLLITVKILKNIYFKKYLNKQ